MERKRKICDRLRGAYKRKFEGEYKDGKKWNGNFYNPKKEKKKKMKKKIIFLEL